MKKIEIPRLYFIGLHVLLLAAVIGLIFLFTGIELTLGSITHRDVKVATIGHRGASGYAPEHTMSAYRLGSRMNADYLEIDLQLTKDGELIAMHDETVNRTTNGKGYVKKMTLAEIKALDAGSWFNEKHPMYARDEYVNEKVPTLREIFETFGKNTLYMLETKSPDEHPGLEEKMCALIEEFGLTKQVAVQSFSKSSLLKIREWNKDVPLFQLLWYNFPASISSAKLHDIKQYAVGIGANFLMIDESYAHKVMNVGLLLYPYTVNYQVNMDKAMQWGVDGIHTDYPDRFKEVIQETGRG